MCADILRKADFEVRPTAVTVDYGADLIAEKDGLSFAIQCKDLNKPVGVKGVQQAAASKKHYRTDFACVCADSGYTDAALELATLNNVLIANSVNLVARLNAF